MTAFVSFLFILFSKKRRFNAKSNGEKNLICGKTGFLLVSKTPGRKRNEPVQFNTISDE